MNAPLRFNEALLIANHAFTPLQCVAWTPQNGTDELSLTVIDRTSTPLVKKRLSSLNIDADQFELLIKEARSELEKQGHQLQGWSMPH